MNILINGTLINNKIFILKINIYQLNHNMFNIEENKTIIKAYYLFI